MFVNFRTPQLRLILAASLVVKLKESLRVSRATYVATFCVTEISRQDLNHYYIAFNIYIRYFLCKSCANQETETRMAFGHVTRHDSLSKTILHGTWKGGRRRGRQRKCWRDKVKEWTSLLMPELLTSASCRKDWKRSLLNRPSCGQTTVNSFRGSL